MDGMDLSSIPFFTEFSNIKSNFVHLIAMLDSSDVPTVNLLSLLSAHSYLSPKVTNSSKKLLGFKIRAKSNVHKISDKIYHQGLRY